MRTVEPHYATEHFAALLEAVKSGAEIIVVENGRSVARIVPVREDAALDEDQVPREEVEQAFYGD